MPCPCDHASSHRIDKLNRTVLTCRVEVIRMTDEEARKWALKKCPYEEQVEAWLNPPLPYGDSIKVRGGAMMGVWPIRSTLIPRVEDMAKEWSGFRLIIGDPVDHDSTTPNPRGVPYFIGDVPCWFEIDDVQEAFRTLKERSDVILPLVIDPIRYADEPDYAEVADLYEVYFNEYYWNGEPVRLSYEDDEAEV